MRLSVTLALLLLLPTLAMAKSVADIEFYVAPNGNDGDPGTKGKPFATLERARDAVRVAKRDGGFSACPLTVWIRGGTYRVEKTFTLTAEDSGTPYAPITYRACEGEDVRLVGGMRVKDFRSATDDRLADDARGKVLQADLKALGITDYGRLSRRGFGQPTIPSGLELFFDNQPMTLARWPNDGWAKIADVPEEGGKFKFEGDRPNTWAGEEDIWVHGYWTWDWAESYEKVKSIDLQAREIATEPPHGVYGYKKGARWYALNLLAELDQPGEWYLDRKTGILYFWPPKPIDRGEVWVSLLESPMISMTDTAYITIRDATMEFGRGTAVTINGGKRNLIAACTMRNLGNMAVNVGGGTQNGVKGCDIYNIRDGAIALSGGDRPTLTAAGNYVENCDIHHFGQWVRTYVPGVAINGAGNRIAHNLIHDAPHCAILLHGNDHTIEFNEVHEVCMETGDAGAFYLGRDWTERGNLVRFNYFHHLHGVKGQSGFTDVMAIYLDDWASGTRVYGNVCYKAGRAVLVGGGRDNTIENNIFVDCEPAVHVDARGLGWAKSYFDGSDNTLFERYRAMNASQPPYSTRYPGLANLLNDEPVMPKGNVIERNICFGGKWLQLLNGMTDKVIAIRYNLVDQDPGFVDLAQGDFRLRDDSPAFKLGFKRIPMEEIGLQKDEYRTR